MAEVLRLDARARDGEPDILVAPGEDVRAHAGLGNLGIIGIAFPKFREGRGYSSARILREMGFAGDLRAVGDVTLDQLVFLKRAGFSSVAPDRAIDARAAEVALARFPFHYQRWVEGGAAAFDLRQDERPEQHPGEAGHGDADR